MSTLNIDELSKKGLTHFPFLGYAECKTLLTELSGHKLTPAVLEAGPRKVKQNFEEADLLINAAPKTMKYLRSLESLIRHDATHLPKEFIFNEFRLQRYNPPLEIGVDRHKDSKRFKYVVAVVVLKDGGDFFVFDDDPDIGPHVVPATVGSCIILQGAGYGEIDMRPYHSVADIKQERFTIGCRFDSKLI